MGEMMIRAPETHTNGTAPDADLRVKLDELTKQVKAMGSWDDRLGSAVKRSTHWMAFAFILLLINGALVWYSQQIRPDILPYLYVVDPQGEVLWKGVPGTLEIRDAFVLNHLEDWIIDARSREDSLIAVAKAWDRAVKMTVKDSPCREMFTKYMHETNPMHMNPLPRTDVTIMTKKVKMREETHGWYRLSWQEKHYNPLGQVSSQPMWEADFHVQLNPPKKFLEAQQNNRYGMVIDQCLWGEVQPIQYGG
jgi:type IV secretory pathway TrbF-like protein